MTCHSCHKHDSIPWRFFVAGTYRPLLQMLLLQRELVGWVKPNGGVREEHLHPWNSVQPSLSKEHYAGKTSYLQGLPWVLMGSFSPTHVYELPHCHTWATCTFCFDKSTLKTPLCCLVPAREGRRVWGRCWGLVLRPPRFCPMPAGGQEHPHKRPKAATFGWPASWPSLEWGCCLQGAETNGCV